MKYFIRISKVDDRGLAQAATLLKIPDSITRMTDDEMAKEIGSRVAAVIRKFEGARGETR